MMISMILIHREIEREREDIFDLLVVSIYIFINNSINDIWLKISIAKNQFL
jgi:hypothetical protein